MTTPPQQPAKGDAHPLVEAIAEGCSRQPWGAIPEIVVFGGYAAGLVGDGPDGTAPPALTLSYTPDPNDAGAAGWGEAWILFYLESSLQSWLLVRRCDIVRHHRVFDNRLPYGGYDVIWVYRHGPCGRGTGPFSVQARFLAGQFTAAGDIEASPRSGTFAPSQTGLLCDINTPTCCNKGTR